MATATLSASPVRTSHRSRAEALARLIAAQQADAQRFRLHGTHEADLAPDGEPGRQVLNELADPKAVDPAAAAEAVELVELADPTEGARRRACNLVGIALVGVSVVWDARMVRYRPKAGRCPACNDAPLGRGSHCVVCSASSEDPRRHPARGTPPLSAKVRRPARDRKGRILAGGVGK